MGVVYECVQQSLGRHVALKVLPQQAPAGSSRLERFRLEARAAARLHHTNIVPVFAVGECEGVHYYAMQFIQGQGLDVIIDALRRLRNDGGLAIEADKVASGTTDGDRPLTAILSHALVSGRFAAAPSESGPESEPTDAMDSTGTVPPPHRPLDPVRGRASGSPAPDVGRSSELSTGQSGAPYYRSVARVGVQVAEALAYAHGQGILHRDIKPSNLLLDAKGTVWVADFGLAKAEGSDPMTRTGDIVGTLRYLAPERFDGWSDPRSDVYALGATLYELLMLRPPFEESDRVKLIEQVLHESPTPPRNVDRRIPRDLETIVLKAMAKEPGQRYTTAEQMAEDLRRFVADRPILARRITPAERAWRWAGRNKPVAGLLTLLAVVLFGGFAGMAVLWARAERYAMTESQARAQAQEQTGIAQAQVRIAGKRAEELRRHDYISRVNLAYRECLANNVGQALELLDDCPEDLRSWEWLYVSRQCHLDLHTFRAPGLAVNAVAFSPDGRRLAFVSGSRPDMPGGSGDLVVLDVATGQEVFAHRGHPGGIRAVAFSPDGRWLAAGHAATWTIWDTATGLERLHKTEPGRVALLSLSYSPDGRRIIAGYGDFDLWDIGHRGYAKLWDATTGDVLIDRFPGEGGGVWSVAFSPDGEQVAIATSTGRVAVWDLASRQQVHTLRGHTSFVYAVAFSLDGRYLATGGWDSTIRLWDRATGAHVRTYTGNRGKIHGLYFSPDGQWIVSASGGGDRSLKLWSVASGLELATFHGHLHSVQCVAFSPDGSQIASGSADRTVKLWFATPNLQLTVGGQRAHVRSVAFSPDGKLVASAALDNHPLWDPTTGEERLSFETQGGLGALAFSPDGRRLASAALTPEVIVRDATSGRKMLTLMGTMHDVIRSSVAFSPDGQTLAVADNDESVKVWNVITGRRLRTLHGHTAPVWGVAFSPDGQTLASAGDDKTVRVWSASTGQQLLTLRGHTGYVRNVAFSPDGRQLAAVGGGSLNLEVRGADAETSGPLFTSAGVDSQPFGEAKVWDPSTGRELYQLRGHTSVVNSVAYSPDGRRLATASDDGTIKLWDTGTGQEVFTLRGHTSRVLCVAFSPDGRRIVSGSSDQTAKVWDVDASRAEVLSRREAVAQAASGESFLQAGRWDQAAAALTRALTLKVDNSRLRLARGQALAGLGQFPQAEADFAEVIRRQPQDLQVRCYHVLSLLEMGDQAGLRRACSDLLGEFGTATDPLVANNVARYCLLGPGAVADCAAPVRLAELALNGAAEAQKPNFLNALGAALYRAGRFEESVRRLEEGIRKRGGESLPQDWAFLALAHHRLGRHAEARQWLDRLRSRQADGEPNRFWDELEIRLLCREAEAVIHIDPIFPADPFSR
jgi:WD40 repeat protein